jgi:YVTN family beta-propeller protein
VLPLGTNKSGPIDVTADGRLVVAANTDTDTVSIFEVRKNGLLQKQGEVRVGDEPRSVATLLREPLAYVANTASGTVSVIELDDADYEIERTIDVGTEPQAVLASPNGSYVYVANASDDSVQVIETRKNRVIATIPVGRSPRALAITNDGDRDDRDETLYVPNFFARPRAGFTPPSSADLGGSAGAQRAGRDRKGHIRRLPRGRGRRDLGGHPRGGGPRGPGADRRHGLQLPPRRLHQHACATPRRAAHDLRRRRRGRRAGAADRGLPEPAAEHRALPRPRLRAEHGRVPRAAAALQPERP